MVKEIDRAGFPIVHVTNLVSVSKVTGANRIVPGYGLVSPFSDPLLTAEEQKAMHKRRFERAIMAVSRHFTDPTFFKKHKWGI